MALCVCLTGCMTERKSNRMATRYDVWLKSEYNSGNKKPIDTYYLLDTAIEAVKKLSKGQTHKASVWTAKINKANPWGSYEEVEQPNIYIVVSKEKLTTLRGFGIDGKFLYPKDCKRCKDTGVDVNNWVLACAACDGAGFKLK